MENWLGKLNPQQTKKKWRNLVDRAHSRFGELSSRLPSSVLLISSLSVSLILFVYSLANTERENSVQIDRAARQVQTAIRQRMKAYEDVLLHTRALFVVHQSRNSEVARRDYSAFVEALDLERRYPGIRGLAFAPFIRTHETEDFVTRGRRETGSKFELWPKSQNDFHVPILYIEPLDWRNTRALGFDLATEARRLHALQRAIDTGEPAFTRAIILAQETNRNAQAGFIILVPVFESGAPVRTIEERRRAITGFIGAPFRANELFSELFSEQPAHRLMDINISDLGDPNLLPAAQQLLYSSSGNEFLELAATDRRVVFDLPGAAWLVTMRPRPEFLAELRPTTPWIILASGLLLSLLFYHAGRSYENYLRQQEEWAKQLAKDKVALQSLNLAKDEFLAVLSHELRTPLTVIQGNAELLRSRSNDQIAVADSVDAIYRSAINQGQIIDDLLDTSSIITGKIRLQKTRCTLKELIEEAIAHSRAAVESKSIRLTPDIHQGETQIEVDQKRFQQILGHLISNSIKFTSQNGRINIGAQVEGNNALIWVSDNGKGMEPNFVAHVFDRFRQEETGSNRRHGGLGLGLSIAESLVKMHGGEIAAASSGRDLGSRFTISIPLPDGNTPAADRYAAFEALASSTASALGPLASQLGASLTGTRILVVDDEPDARRLIVRYMERAGAQVQSAGSANEALAIYDEFSPNLVLSDISMPEVDGYQFIRNLRRREFERHLPPTPALAITAYAREEDRLRALSAGFQGHIAKPVGGAALTQAAANALVDFSSPGL